MATQYMTPTRRLWAVRGIWVLLVVVAYFFLAVSTPTPYVNVPARPLLSLAVVALLIGSYPWLKARLGLAEE